MAALWTVSAWAEQFTLEDLKTIVKELETVAIKNDKYKYPIECIIVPDEDPNAYATAYDTGKDGEKPQALVALHQGMIDLVKGDKRMIRAIFAHEVAHLSMGHCRRARFIGADFENAWTRQQELEADSYGLQLMLRLGYPKKDMIDMLLMLDGIDGREGGWLPRLTGTHPDPKSRAAELSDNPRVLRAMVQFDAGLAFMDCRSFGRAGDLFAEAIGMEPNFEEAYINLAQARLMDYWENLGQNIVNTYFRVDFGPALTQIKSVQGKATVITTEDRERYDEAMEALKQAVEKTKSERAKELMAIAKILNPDRNAITIQEGVDAMMKLSPLDADEAFRFANNAAVGLLALNKPNEGYRVLLDEWRKGESGSDAGAENLARIKTTGRSKEDETMAAAIYEVYLANSPSATPAYNLVKQAYLESCKLAGLTAKDIKPAPIYLTRAASIFFNNQEIAQLDKVDTVLNKLGKADLLIYFSDKWRDMNELRWAGGEFSVFVERGTVLRVTSYAAGSYLLIKPIDTSVRAEYRISVGMSEADLSKWLNLEGGSERELIRGGDLEKWTYFGGLNMGVLMKDGKVAGITVTPVKAPQG